MSDIQVSDTEMLDWLDKHTKGCCGGWICQDSFPGRGLRLHETNMKGAKPTVRKAIIAAMQCCEAGAYKVEAVPGMYGRNRGPATLVCGRLGAAAARYGRASGWDTIHGREPWW